jgi:hypothetical protein
MSNDHDEEKVLGLDPAARTALAFRRWREGTCQYLCGICDEKGGEVVSGSSMRVRAHLYKHHRSERGRMR